MKADQIIDAVQAVTGKWAKQRKAEERHANAAADRWDAMTGERRITIKEAAYDAMPAAYARRAPTAPCRRWRGRSCTRRARRSWPAPARSSSTTSTSRSTCCRTSWPSSPGLTADWNVVFDARGNFVEPHTEKRVPLGTLNVRDYLAKISGHTVEAPDFDIWERHHPTIGPANRFGAVLFVEKEGFNPLFERCGSPSATTWPSCPQRDERHREPGAGRVRVRPRRAAPGPARLRQERILDRRHARGAPPAAINSATATPAG